MNWNILGHEWAVSLLKEHVIRQRPRHAYLITGASGLGRRTLALRLAQALNCIQPPAPGEACGGCRACVQIERMAHPDLTIVQADTAGGTLKVDQVRELQHSLALAPYEARYRVALLLRFEEAHLSAANALLKTLEEPPPQVIIILTALDAEVLLPTIVSRCEVIRLRPASLAQVSQGLIDLRSAAPEQAQLLAHLAGGRPGYALQLHDESDLQTQRATWLDDHAGLLNADLADRFAYAEQLAKNRELLQPALTIWLSLWRDVLLQTAAPTDRAAITNIDRLEEIEALARQVDLQQACAVIKTFEKTLERLSHNTNPRLTLEVLLLDLPRIRLQVN